MRHLALTALLLPTPLLAEGFDCSFNTECFEAEACAEANFTASVDVESEKITTEFGDLTIVAVKQETRTMTLFATGAGAEYLLSVTPQAARLTTHANEGPMVISYLGTCEGAF